MSKLIKWFHAIGICGRTTANVANMFKKMGWFVTGSDTQFFSPAMDVLINNNLFYSEGYSYKHLTKDYWIHESSFSELICKEYNVSLIPKHPDLCLIVESATSKNKEYLFAKAKNIPVLPFSKILQKYLVKKESIVVVGTAGKTTTTALLTLALQKLDLNPSYMIGAEVNDFVESLANTNSNWSVVEGDEFYNPQLSEAPKFMFFNPKYLVITNIGWEHQDLYVTRDDYINSFIELIKIVDKDGFIVCKHSEILPQLRDVATTKLITFDFDDSTSTNHNIDYVISIESNIVQFISKISNTVIQMPKDKIKLIGKFNLLNYLALFAVLEQLSNINVFSKNIFRDIFIDVLSSFRGAKKRLEVLFKDDNICIIDDFGITPTRAQNSLEVIHENFLGYKIYVVFEPNSGSRTGTHEELIQMYKDKFNLAHEVIIPTLSQPLPNQNLIDAHNLTMLLKYLNINAVHIDTYEKIFEYLVDVIVQHKRNNAKMVILFSSSYRLDKLTKDFIKLI
ncbi:MAG: Mur ligase family protein [Candidatus Dojkabacteria bacterium]|nr:Mur ligase family protein [Candidatus Dojkabacteria bacterium]